VAECGSTGIPAKGGNARRQKKSDSILERGALRHACLRVSPYQRSPYLFTQTTWTIVHCPLELLSLSRRINCNENLRQTRESLGKLNLLFFEPYRIDRFWDTVVETSFAFYCFCQCIDKVNKKICKVCSWIEYVYELRYRILHVCIILQCTANAMPCHASKKLTLAQALIACGQVHCTSLWSVSWWPIQGVPKTSIPNLRPQLWANGNYYAN